MVFFGLFAIILNFFDRVPTILMWIYNWGEIAAWTIKLGLIVVGIILYVIGNKNEKEDLNDEREALENISK